MAGAAAATSAAAVVLKDLLPREYLAVLTRGVIESITAVRRRPLAGAAPDMSEWTGTQLLQAFKSGTVPKDDVVLHLTTKIASATAEEVEGLKLILEGLKLMHSCRSDAGGSSKDAARDGEPVGLLLYIWSLCGKIVERRNDGSVSVQLGTGSGAASSKLTSKFRPPKSMEEFSEYLSAFTAIAHSLGISNVLATTAFFRRLVYNGMNGDGYPWQLAHALMWIYFEDVDNSESLTLLTILDSGGQDTRLGRARTLVKSQFPHYIFRSSGLSHDDNDDKSKGGGVKWNKKDTPNAKGCCVAFNFGNDNHKAKYLLEDGTCKFAHACNKWVDNKGPYGQCRSTKHNALKCDNPNKCDNPVTG